MTLARTGIVQAEGKHLGQGAALTRSLQLLLGDIAAGKVDVVVVYKIDRLTRSLSDFSRIVEIFEKASTSFVSVTQAFNTTTSMGRLMLNVLLWFAQFEREVTGERIRSKLRTTSSGKTSGGTTFSRGALFHLLRNRIYLGQIVQRSIAPEGKHQAMVDTNLFARVQQMLDGNAWRHRTAAEHRIVKAPLTGKLFDAAGETMSTTFSRGKSGRAYCYYVSGSLQQGWASIDDGTIRRVSASALEKMLTDLAARLALGEFILHTGRTSVRVEVVLALPLRGGKRHILAGDRTGAQPDSTLIAALRKAPRVTQSERGISVVQAAPPSAYDRMILRLAFLAPDIQRDSLAGHQPPELNLERLRNIDIPLAWSEERKVLGWRDTDAACSAK